MVKRLEAQVPNMEHLLKRMERLIIRKTPENGKIPANLTVKNIFTMSAMLRPII